MKNVLCFTLLTFTSHTDILCWETIKKVWIIIKAPLTSAAIYQQVTESPICRRLLTITLNWLNC